MASNSAAVQFDVLAIKEFSNAAAGTLKDSAGTDIKCDARVPFKIGATTYYLAAYDTTG